MFSENKQSFKNLTCKDYGKPAKVQHLPLQELTKPHIESFNWVLREGLVKAVKDLDPVEFELLNGQRVSLYVKDPVIDGPVVHKSNVHAVTLKLFPAECRERAATYCGRLQVHIGWRLDGVHRGELDRVAGEVPIMVKSSICNLAKLSPAELIKHGEEAEEMGGYFIINGIERVVRMLIMPRRNLPVVFKRSSWKSRGPNYTEFGCSLRSVNISQISATQVLHYLTNGTANLSFSYLKEMFFVPIILILKALNDVSDEYVYRELLKGRKSDSFYKGCVTNMLRQAQQEKLSTQKAVLQYIGERFRVKLGRPAWYTDTQVALFLLRRCICTHLENNVDKFNLLLYMTRKLYSFVNGECIAEVPDNIMFQEVLTSGYLYQMLLVEKLETWLQSIKSRILMNNRAKGTDFTVDASVLSAACVNCTNLTRSTEYFFTTGNLISRSGLGLMQATGLTIVADKLNFLRYISHFRCIHRGAFFSQMRTTLVRRLLPEAWGFLCPVHTPDGAPCGLMNHLSATCLVVNTLVPSAPLIPLLCDLGMTSYDGPGAGSEHDYPVMLDGLLIGWLRPEVVGQVADSLRVMKVKGINKVSRSLEIVVVRRSEVGSQYPGLYLFASLARFMRPVLNIALNRVEFIGSFEQVYLDVCVTLAEARSGETTHVELYESAMLSAVGSLTPFSDFNQSPRNMYQCQMGKQTMGTPCHARVHRSDNKLYALQTPQSPLVRPTAYDRYRCDEYPNGTNAVVAVISYTGYDMEDAMILNKSSHERGFSHGSIYKSQMINLRKLGGTRHRMLYKFGCLPGHPELEGKIDVDGLPSVGTYLELDAPYYSYVNVQTGEMSVKTYRDPEPAWVDQVKILGGASGTEELEHVCIVLRMQRNPIIGDKFASRHGQKGICSQKWPVENMPFTESGMTPDIVFNPHGFPSRMTIGMLIESMAGKSAAMHAICHDATPFQFSEEQPAIDFFGQALREAGYNYYGTERMYSGVNGRELEADIFIGVVYYQRLRHMVSDKFQVRATGPIDNLTHQPVKGRKMAGGIRFGEMERDAMLAHGASFLLQDRLLNCSDRCMGYVCTTCGSLLSPRPSRVSPLASLTPVGAGAVAGDAPGRWVCATCPDGGACEAITLPYVFRYLIAELAAMNIKVRLDARQC